MADTNTGSGIAKGFVLTQSSVWRYFFGEVDTRWLAIFRILFSLVLLKDAVYHLFLAEIFYSDAGVVPRWALFDGLVRDTRFSLMDAVGQPWLAFLFFCVWIVVLICLMLGYRTRLMAILNFIIILSVHERNGYILTSADTLMRVMSFWMMFAPIGQYYTIDAIWRRWQRFRETALVSDLRVLGRPRTAFALPVRLLQWQLIIVYLSTGYLKTQGAIWQNGDVMHYITQIETFIMPMGRWLAFLPEFMLKGLSYYSMYAEIAIPVLLISPFLWRWSRVLAFGLALILHGGIALTMSIPDFSIVMILCYLPFFDPAWMRWLKDRFRRSHDPVQVSVPDAYYSPDWLWFSITDDETLTALSVKKTDSPDVRTLTAVLPFSRLWDWIFIWAPAQQALRWLMEHAVMRFRDKPFIHRTPSETMWHLQRYLLTITLLPLFMLIIMWNVEETTAYTEHDVMYPAPIERLWQAGQNIIWYTGLWQYWDMFSPTPIQYDGWIIIEGEFENGFSYDVFTGEPIDLETPTRWYWGPQMRWEKFEENAFRWQYRSLLNAWAGYYCRTLNENSVSGTRLATLKIQMVYTNFYPPGGTPNELQIELMWTHWCFDEFAPQG